MEEMMKQHKWKWVGRQSLDQNQQGTRQPKNGIRRFAEVVNNG